MFVDFEMARKNKSNNKTKKQEKSVDSIPLKRLTRSNTLKSKGKIQQQKKIESEIVPRAARSLKIPNVIQKQSTVEKKIEREVKSQLEIPQRVTRSLKIKKTLSNSKLQEEKNPNSNSKRVTRSVDKSAQSYVVPDLVTPSFVRNESRIEKRVNFIKLEKFEINTICLAKQKYSSPWPAQILEIEEDKILVHFFGDKRVGYVESTEVYDFIKSSGAIQSILFAKRKPRGYITGVVEVERLLKIDSAHSILNKN